MTTTTPANDGTTPQDFVYTGRRTLNSGLMAISVRPIKSDGTLADERWFKFDRKGHRSVGGIYTGASFSDTLVSGLYANLKFVRRWPEEGDQIEWEARDGAAEATDRARKMEADDKKTSAIEAAMLPLRAQFERFRHMRDRGGMEALRAGVLAALEAPLRPDEREQYELDKARAKRRY